MIKFNQTFKVLKIEDKSITKRDGTPYEFTEAVLEEGDKKKTYLVARVKDGVASSLHEGEKQNLQIEITSWKRDDGKIWNNFVVREVVPSDIPNSYYSDSEDIPF